MRTSRRWKKLKSWLKPSAEDQIIQFLEEKILTWIFFFFFQLHPKMTFSNEFPKELIKMLDLKWWRKSFWWNIEESKMMVTVQSFSVFRSRASKGRKSKGYLYGNIHQVFWCDAIVVRYYQLQKRKENSLRSSFETISWKW